MKLSRSESNYGRRKVAFRDDIECDGCGEFRSCACTDSSMTYAMSEYGAVNLCAECLREILAEPAVEREERAQPPPDTRNPQLTARDAAAALADIFSEKAKRAYSRVASLGILVGLDPETHRTAEQVRLNGEKKT